jgi:SAM-dependent methyltransferase
MPYTAAIRNIALHLARSTKREIESHRPLFLRLQSWAAIPDSVVPNDGAWCVLCRWTGEGFEGIMHSESGTCPRCGSIGRDRFLYLSLIRRVPHQRSLRVLETSPRLNKAYQRVMRHRVHYLSSDYDQRSHRGMIKLDLEEMDLPDESLDVLLTAHVLEHVPDTDAALAEIYRVLRPGGHLLLQVPLLQAATTPPQAPEFHEDSTPVLWRFGLDLTERLRSHGFTTTLLVTEEMYRRVATRDVTWVDPLFPEFNAAALVLHADPADLTIIASEALAERTWLRPCYMFALWHGTKPS